MTQVYVAAGSNSAPGRHLACALAGLTREFSAVRCSGWYRNPAAGAAGNPFVNFVAEFATELPARAVQERLKAIEQHCGRVRAQPAQVALDLDLLLYGDLCVDEEGLRLPRPELLTRAYQLGPLAELAPALRHPVAHLTMAELWERFDKSHHPLEPLPAPLPH